MQPNGGREMTEKPSLFPEITYVEFRHIPKLSRQEFERLLIGGWTAEPETPASVQETARVDTLPDPRLQPRKRWTIWRPKSARNATHKARGRGGGKSAGLGRRPRWSGWVAGDRLAPSPFRSDPRHSAPAPAASGAECAPRGDTPKPLRSASLTAWLYRPGSSCRPESSRRETRPTARATARRGRSACSPGPSPSSTPHAWGPSAPAAIAAPAPA